MSSPLRAPVAWVRAHPRGADAALAGVVAVAAVAVHLFAENHAGEPADPSVAGVVLCLVGTLPLAVRRTHPVMVLVVVTIAQFVLAIMGSDGPGWMAVLIASFSVGAHHTAGHTAWIGGVFSAVASAFVVTGIIIGEAPWGALVSTLVLFPAAIIFGDGMRRRRERLSDMAERAEQMARERELVARQQVQDERTRIARELHDVVAHSVSVMVIQAAAARRQLATNPARATEALEAIESTGRNAMDEMRRILGVLRQDAGADARAPAPSLATLPALIASDPGLPVALRIDGDLAGVPAGVELHAYRVVQEALTNTRRHAGPVRTVTVTVARRGDTLEVEIADDGRGASTLVGNSAARGHGLAGMRERVVAAGGRLTAGPRQGGGWRVHALFPIAAAEPVESNASALTP